MVISMWLWSRWVVGCARMRTPADPLLDGYEEYEQCSGGRGQPLIPWPNRLRDGRYEFAGSGYQMALTEPEAHNAIHGLVRWANWTVGARAENRIVMEHVLYPQTGWPGVLQIGSSTRSATTGCRSRRPRPTSAPRRSPTARASIRI